jgi:hypothetical protein
MFIGMKAACRRWKRFVQQPPVCKNIGISEAGNRERQVGRYFIRRKGDQQDIHVMGNVKFVIEGVVYKNE